MDRFPTGGGRFSKEEEADEEQEDASVSRREIPFMTASSSAAASASSASASASASSGAPFRSASAGDGAGASGSGGGEGEAEAAVEKEHMFDKVVTPSDVGKLNRLVIPKQYAEKYFPLDAAANEKGLLLGFEDSAGKQWRFRYSYWNSSQSYVMTKGWSRFVKEKRLDAGDTVSFGRGVGEHARGRLFIDWRRRPDPPAPYHHHRFPLPSVPFAPWPAHYPAAGIGGTSSMLHLPPSPYEYADSHHHRRHDAYYYGPINTRKLHFYRPHQQATLVLDSVPVRIPTTTAPGHAETPSSVGSSGTKRLRLFGVNLDCAGSEEENQAGRMSAPPQLPSPPSSSSSSSGKPRCSLNLDL